MLHPDVQTQSRIDDIGEGSAVIAGWGADERCWLVSATEAVLWPQLHEAFLSAYMYLSL